MDDRPGGNDNGGTLEDRLHARDERTFQYCQRSYRQTHQKCARTDTVCMREDPSYADTVRDFRDRRHKLQQLTKSRGGEVNEAPKSIDSEATLHDFL